jgi:hypothetical protein
VPDYSEFPTTPTAWQAIHELPVEDPPPRRGVDLVALVPGLFFSVLAIVLMSGIDLPLGLFRDGGILWAVLIGGGVVLLAKELRRRR